MLKMNEPPLWFKKSFWRTVEAVTPPFPAGYPTELSYAQSDFVRFREKEWARNIPIVPISHAFPEGRKICPIRTILIRRIEGRRILSWNDMPNDLRFQYRTR